MTKYKPQEELMLTGQEMYRMARISKLWDCLQGKFKIDLEVFTAILVDAEKAGKKSWTDEELFALIFKLRDAQEAIMDEKNQTRAQLISVSGNPMKYDFYVLSGNNSRQSRMIELQMGGKPNQVCLFFGDAPRIEFGSNDGDLVELFLPTSMLNDLLYVLNNWKTTYFSVAYKDDTKEIVNFILYSVQKGRTGRAKTPPEGRRKQVPVR